MEDKEKKTSAMGTCIAFGPLAGAILGLIIFDDYVLGLVIGLALGVLVGAIIDMQRGASDKPAS